MSAPAVVMGDPGEFEILHGSNPHTRHFWGGLKRVDRRLARLQWNIFADQLRAAGVDTRVMPPVSGCPGLVYPANAGIIIGRTFYPSNLLPSRAPERPHYEKFFSELGFSVAPFARASSVPVPFEGEADFFPWGNRMIFTYGKIARQRTAMTARFPFFKRVYGFRSDIAALAELRQIVPGREILPLELCDERYYHGDTCLCSFGVRRENLLVYPPALTPAARAALAGVPPSGHVIEIDDADARCYAANSFAVTVNGVPHLFMPSAASRNLKRRVSDLGVTVVDVLVSEFLKKGGGSVKCMVFDLSSAF